MSTVTNGMSTAMNGKTWNIYFCGIGGQGVLKASEVCGWAALHEGYHVKKSEVHGMSQRGGSVESHLRFGKNVYSPLIPDGAADVLVSFYRDEHDRMLHFLKDGGIDLVEYYERAEKEISDRRFRNTYILGVLSHHLPISGESWMKALREVFPKAFDENREVFLAGKKAGEGDGA